MDENELLKELQDIIDILYECKYFLLSLELMIERYGVRVSCGGEVSYYIKNMKSDNFRIECNEDRCILEDERSLNIAKVNRLGANVERWDRYKGWIKDETAIKEFEVLEDEIKKSVKELRELGELIATIRTMIKMLRK
jgi:hypothetical protein